ncbi:MAG TPA: LysR family transcriptional regulator [Elusimicrobiota bacterium]|nr:LysR family transcriptional regulator [Elusimicrobiota bacterium]
MINLNYHHLYYFWTVARLGGISAAARELNLAQPTLSAQLAALERRCGRKLLVRGPWGARLTPEGEAVLQHCRRIFEAGSQLEADIAAGLDEAPRSLRLGAHGAVPRAVIMQVLDAIRAGDPAVRAIVASGTPEGIADRMESRVLDVAVATLDLSLRLGPAFRGRPIGTIPLVFVAAPSVARRARRFPQGLSDVPMLLRGPDNPVTKQVDQYLRSHGVKPRVEAEVDDAELLRTLALAGRGAAALELPIARADLAAGRLVRLHAAPSGLRETIWLIASRDEHARPGLEKALAALGRLSLGRDLSGSPRL